MTIGNWIAILSLIVAAIALLFTIIKFGKGSQRDRDKETENRVTVNLKLDNLTTTMAGIGKDILKMQSTMEKANTEIAQIKIEIKNLWKKTEDIQDRMDKKGE